ncbi:MAG: ACT domain-containing protein [Pseudomonadota bacterium]
MQSAYILTCIGDDRPGLVESLSEVIEKRGGNWLESRLSQLGGKFAGLVLVTLPQEQAAALEKELKSLAASGLSVRVTPAGTHSDTYRGRHIKLSLIGPDRSGIVRQVSKALAQSGVNVIEMESAVESAPMSAELLFNARIDAEIPEHISLHELDEQLDAIANTMTLDIELDYDN